MLTVVMLSMLKLLLDVCELPNKYILHSCITVAVLSLRDAVCEERSGLSFVAVIASITDMYAAIHELLMQFF